MKEYEYKVMYEIEDRYWWYLGLRHLTEEAIKLILKERDEKKLRILDAGCGTGANLVMFNKYGEAYGFDFSFTALNYCKKRSLKNLCCASIVSIPFPDDFFDLVISYDVLYYLEEKDLKRALFELSRVLRSEGYLLLNLPALKILKGKHDQAVHIKHRFTAAELGRYLSENSFRYECLTYRLAFLFPGLIIIRPMTLLLTKRETSPESDLKPLPEWLNDLILKLHLLENKLILKRIKFPFGSSVFCMARKIG